jgi:hypothetical protein
MMRTTMASHVHVIPVDPSLSPDDAWKELCIFGRRLTFTGPECWSVVKCDGEECSGIDPGPVSDAAQS